VIAAAISPVRGDAREGARGWSRSSGPFVEVHVKASVDECARRDVKGLYAKAFAGEIKGFTGVDDPYEEPAAPEIVIDTEEHEPEESARLIVDAARGARPRRPRWRRDDRRRGHADRAARRPPRRPDGRAPGRRRLARGRDAHVARVSDLDMIACGALSPLEGFMGRDDYASVLDGHASRGGLPWALPVCLAVDAAPSGDVVALADEAGTLLGTLDVEDTFSYDKETEAERAFRTTDDAHPGVRDSSPRSRSTSQGKVTVFERPAPQFPSSRATPPRRAPRSPSAAGSASWASRRRNPIHRAHEYLTKTALETVDGPADPPARRRHEVGRRARGDAVECYRVLVDGYYPADRVLVSAFPAAMRYAGPRRRSGTRSAARTTAARTSSWAATTRASAATTAPTTRS
jgi:sulfate adenylyltransferase/3'-phosphoadenosine 5'-phosphosulfate synthase